MTEAEYILRQNLDVLRQIKALLGKWMGEKDQEVWQMQELTRLKLEHIEKQLKELREKEGYKHG